MTAGNASLRKRIIGGNAAGVVPDAAPYHRLALQLHYELPHDQQPRSVMLATPAPSPLAAHVSISLAHSMAQELQKPVLLIDADGRTGTLSSILGCTGAQGFSELLLEAGMPLQDLVLPTNDEHVYFLPAGQVGRSTRQRPNVEAVGAALAAASNYDFLILAGGSVLNDSLALGIAPHVGCVLMIPVEHETLAEDLDVAQRSLRFCKARKIGLLLATAVLGEH